MAMMVATMPSMRSVDLSLAGLRLPAGSWATATFGDPARQTKNMEYSGWGSSWATMARPMAMMRATMPSMRSVRLVLGGLEVAGGVLGDGDVGGHPAGDRVAAMRELPRDDQLLELAGRRRHGAEALAELDHRGALVLQAQRDVGRVPGVVGDLLDLEQGGIGEDPLLDRAVVDDIAGGRLDEALPGPEVVGHAVALGALAQVAPRARSSATARARGHRRPRAGTPRRAR